MVGDDGLLTAAPARRSPRRASARSAASSGRRTRPSSSSRTRTTGPARAASRRSPTPDGTLTSIGASPFHNNQTAPCWVEISQDGLSLFSVNTAVSTVSSYSIGADGSLTLLGSTPVGATGGVGTVDARLSPDGRTLFVDESRIGAVGAFAVTGGTLTELTSSPTSLPAGATPAGIVVT